MSIYYMLLMVARFLNDPRVGEKLFDAGIVVVTPVKVVGLLAVLAALFLPKPADAAPYLRNPLGSLFVAFALLPVFTTVSFGLPIPEASLSSLISLGLMLLVTRVLISTEDRMVGTLRV